MNTFFGVGKIIMYVLATNYFLEYICMGLTEEFPYNLRGIKYIINKVKVQINFLVIFNEKYLLVIFSEK